jgi:hypothetical protein
MASDLLFIPRISARMNERGESVWADLSFGLDHLFHEGLHPLSPQHPRNRARAAKQIQALWRGYKTRKSLQEHHAQQVREVLPLWRSLDEQYELYVFSQTLMCELKGDDPSWDATKTHYYIWMLEYGPQIVEWESWMRLRGWQRPKKRNFNVGKALRFMEGVLYSCAIEKDDPRVLTAFLRTLEMTQ